MMTGSQQILLLRDEDGAPFLIPQDVVERQELAAFRVGGTAYLLPRASLMETLVPAEHTAELAQLVSAGNGSDRVDLAGAASSPSLAGMARSGATEALAIRNAAGTYFLIPADVLEQARVGPEHEALVDTVLSGGEVAGFTFGTTAGLLQIQPSAEPLGFEVNRLDTRQAFNARTFGGVNGLFTS
jgi:hypothetical protein